MSDLWPTDAFDMTCQQSGTEYKITVSLPARFGTIERPPVIICLDGPWIFGSVVDATRIMSMSGEAPEAIVVGVGFAAGSMGEYLRERARWFTPTPFVPPPEVGVKGLTAHECGKAYVLLAMLADQLLPRIEAEYNTGERWFVGHSFSALFGMRVLLTEPDLFQRWLLASPSIWWDDKAILGVEQAWADGHDDLPASVYLSAGQDESLLDLVGAFAMVENVEELQATLAGRGYPNLRIYSQVLPGESHSSTIGAAVTHGLRTLHLSALGPLLGS